MAELEVAKHGKKVIQLVGAREHGWGHRLQHIAIEVATIVFAVWFSIWLHGLTDHQHKQDEVRVFLTGLKTDLQRDIKVIETMTATYHDLDGNFRYLAGLDPHAAPDLKRFGEAWTLADANTFFIPVKSRYEGFLMSGKLGNIEDPELMNEILNLYQNLLSQLQISERGWLARQEKLRNYRDDASSGDDPLDHFRLATSPKGKRLLGNMQTAGQHYERYDAYVTQARAIIAKIDAAYPGQAGAGKH